MVTLLYFIWLSLFCVTALLALRLATQGQVISDLRVCPACCAVLRSAEDFVGHRGVTAQLVAVRGYAGCRAAL